MWRSKVMKKAKIIAVVIIETLDKLSMHLNSSGVGTSWRIVIIHCGILF